MSAEDRKRAAWVKKNERDPGVLLWLSENKPPKSWKGTPAEYAYAEMPQGDKVTALVVGLGLAGLVVGTVWLLNRPRPQPPLYAGEAQGAALTMVPRQRYGV